MEMPKVRFTKGEIVKFFILTRSQYKQMKNITVTKVENGIVTAYSNKTRAMDPIPMSFNAISGMGIEDFKGTRIVRLENSVIC